MLSLKFLIKIGDANLKFLHFNDLCKSKVEKNITSPLFSLIFLVLNLLGKLIGDLFLCGTCPH